MPLMIVCNWKFCIRRSSLQITGSRQLSGILAGCSPSRQLMCWYLKLGHYYFLPFPVCNYPVIWHSTDSVLHWNYCYRPLLLTLCLTSYVGSQVLSSGNIVCEAYHSDITGSAVVLMNEPFISTFRYSMWFTRTVSRQQPEESHTCFITSLSCYLTSSLHLQASGSNFLLSNLLPVVSSLPPSSEEDFLTLLSVHTLLRVTNRVPVLPTSFTRTKAS
jgi:hypothetical protein